MKYALLIYTDQSQRGQAPPEAVEEMYRLYAKFAQDNGSRIVGGEELDATETATTVRIQGGPGGDVVTTDGPFAETKEALAGFYLVDARDLDQAIQIAAQVPSAAFGAIEVRPVAAGPEGRG